jgi:ADP-heptose:LPS heptosyltransferase
MKLSTMYGIDRVVGVPTAWVLSQLHHAKDALLGPPRRREAVQNILFIELSEMGSMILLAPLLDRVRRDFPQANFYFITFSTTRPALSLLGRVDEERIWTVRITSLAALLRDLFGLVFRLRSVRFDIVFDLELFSRISSILSALSGAPIKAGFSNFLAEGLYRGSFVTHPVTYNPHQHITKNFLSMAYAVQSEQGDIPHSKVAISDDELRLELRPIEPASIEAFRRRLLASFPVLESKRRWILLNPNSSQIMPLRRWPIESYAELAVRLVADGETAVLVTGNADEKRESSFICARVPRPEVIDLAGYTSMPELICLYSLASLLISNDSGPAHFSALVQIPAIIFFGPETPDLYGSLNPNAHNFYKHLQCSPCSTAYNHRRSPCRNNVCVKSISVDEVHYKALEILGAISAV